MPGKAITNPAAAAVAGAITNPEAHQGSEGASPAPTPASPATQQPPASTENQPPANNPADGGSHTPASAGSSNIDPNNHVVNPPAEEGAPTAPAAANPAPAAADVDTNDPLAEVTPAQLAARLKELAGEAGVDAETVMAADVNATIARARSQEKDKLYKQLEGARGELQAAQALNAQLTEAQKNLTEKLGTGGAEEPAKPAKEGTAEGGITREQLDSSVAVAVQKTAEALQPQLDALKAENERIKKEAETESLNAYKNELIASNKGSIVEELVTGNSKDELDIALTTARQAHARITANMTPAPGPATPENNIPPTPNATPQQPNTPANPSQAGTGLPDTSSMNLTTFQQNRDALLSDANAAVREHLKNQR